MNGGGGALEQQQGIAARIPYMNLAANPAQNFLNAFAMGVNLNRQRLNMERQMAQLQMQNERINLARESMEQRGEHLGFMETLAQRNSDFREAALNLRQELAEGKITAATNKVNRLNDLNQALFSLESPLGSAARLADMNKIHYEFGDVIGTPEGQRIWNNASGEHNKAATEKQKASSNIFKTADEARRMAGNVSWYDLAQPDNVWGHEPSQAGFPQGKSFLAHDAKTGAVIPYDQIAKFKKEHGEVDADKKPTIIYNSIHSPDLERARGMRDTINKIVAGTLDERPGSAIPSEQRITVTKPDGTQGTIPASQKDAALAAGYIVTP